MFVVFDGLYPFKIRQGAFSELTIKNFTPFYHYFKETSFFNIRDLLYSIIFSVPLGGIVCYWIEIKWRNYKNIAIAASVVLILSISIEITQIFIPTRVADITDIIFMVLGGATGAWLYLYYQDLQSLKD